MGDLADPGALESKASAVDGLAQQVGRELERLVGDINSAIWQGHAATRGRASVDEEANRLSNQQRTLHAVADALRSGARQVRDEIRRREEEARRRAAESHRRAQAAKASTVAA